MTQTIHITISPHDKVQVTDQDMHTLDVFDVVDLEHFHSNPKHLLLHANGHTYLVAVSVTRRPDHLAHI